MTLIKITISCGEQNLWLIMQNIANYNGNNALQEWKSRYPRISYKEACPCQGGGRGTLISFPEVNFLDQISHILKSDESSQIFL